MSPKHSRPRYAAKGKSTHRIRSLNTNEAAVVTALFMLQQTHTVPPELYLIIEKYNLGPKVIEQAKKSGNPRLYDDAIAQWG